MLWAQIPAIRNFTNLDYRGGTQNWCIGRSADRRMIFGNNNGLLVFDSDKWDIYPMPNYTNVRTVHYDEETGRVYVGASDEFGYFSGNPENSKFEYHSLADELPEAQRHFGEIWKVLPFGGDWLFRSRDRLYVKRQSGKMDVVNLPFTVDNSTVVGKLLYISGSEGIVTYDGKTVRPLPGAETMRGKTIHGLLSYEGRLLFVTDDEGLWSYDGQSFSPYVLDITPMLQHYQVYTAHLQGNYMAFGTVRGGLVVKDLSRNRNYYVNAAGGLQNNTVLSLKFDELNNIWLGLDNGISYVMVETPYGHMFGQSNDLGTGYASIVYGGQLYMGTNQGLFLMPWPIPDSPYRPTTPAVSGVSGQIWSLRNIGGTLLCGANEGAFVVQGTQAHRISGLSGTWGFRPLEDHPGYVLASDYDGFAVLRATGSGYEMVNRVQGINVSSVDFEQDADGAIWASHWQKGVYRFRLSADLTRAENVELFDKAHGMPLDGSNFVRKIGRRVYVSSVDGFRNYDPKQRTLVKNEQFNHVFNNFGFALQIMETPTGDIWAYKKDYLAIAYRQKDGTYKVDSVSHRGAARRMQISLGHLSSPDSSHTIMNYDNGFIYVRNRYASTPQTCGVAIRGIYSTGTTDSLLYFDHPKQPERRLVVPHALNSLRFEFVMPEYRDQASVEYECYLENYDREWNLPQHGTHKEYTRLAGGNYVFHVRARNLITGEVAEAQMKLRVLPAWYETWYAYLLYVLLVAGALYLLQRYMKARAERELIRVKKEQERERKEQERELREQQMRFQMEEEKKEKELIKLRNQKLEVDLKQKSSELGDSTMNLVRKNDMLQAIDEEMADLSESVRREDPKARITKKIADIRRGIHNNMNDDDNWGKFQENFDLVYDNFMQKLRTNFPDLKKNDLKLCAYLRMGLSSKEMASLLNVSVRSIETARYRLRKKLSVDSGDNLLEFIQNLGAGEAEEAKA